MAATSKRERWVVPEEPDRTMNQAAAYLHQRAHRTGWLHAVALHEAGFVITGGELAGAGGPRYPLGPRMAVASGHLLSGCCETRAASVTSCAIALLQGCQQQLGGMPPGKKGDP